jgi:hypothetical protein
MSTVRETNQEGHTQCLDRAISRRDRQPLEKGVPERSRSVCVAYGDADQTERRREGAKEEREVGSGVKASDRQRREVQGLLAIGVSRDSSPSPRLSPEPVVPKGLS